MSHRVRASPGRRASRRSVTLVSLGAGMNPGSTDEKALASSSTADGFSPLQRRGPSHLPELGNGEVEMLDGLRAIIGVVLQPELGELEARERDLRSVAKLGRRRFARLTSQVKKSLGP